MNRFIFCVFLLFSLNSIVSAQELDSMMVVYELGSPAEKAHLHFDKNIYNRDETIFYKAYLRMANELSILSKNLYVEWYDTSGLIIKQTVAPIFQSSAKGSFEIPAGYSGNFLHVKAYTSWMLNQDTDYLFRKDILLNAATLPATNKTPTIVERKVMVTVFPEGGTSVAGILNKFAFLAANSFGEPVKIKGSITDSKGKKVDTVLVKHDGMGVFSFTPVSGEMYQLNWMDEYGKKGTVAIDKSSNEGVVLSVKGGNEQATVRIERTESVPANWKKLNLWVHLNQSL
jgi:hypothetical protein